MGEGTADDPFRTALFRSGFMKNFIQGTKVEGIVFDMTKVPVGFAEGIYFNGSQTLGIRTNPNNNDLEVFDGTDRWVIWQGATSTWAANGTDEHIGTWYRYDNMQAGFLDTTAALAFYSAVTGGDNSWTKTPSSAIRTSRRCSRCWTRGTGRTTSSATGT
ncbi:hypothetical protein [Treponema endosymbiont of Eucomonympha sp.]|uniref:hypothetical protein n=1 Tax=Treponema endosymbiont of Eucomonympha sp. TaxID=1580831 RepID=UPI0007517069|nr:hypothetical protein [Treponema endosymbiont of Eucomonympha sp.]